MTRMNKILGFFVVPLISLSFGTFAIADTRTAPTVVELFTSQSCYSCPPAEALLGELAARGDLIALEFHVDYWNDLVYGSAGKWVDVHSSAAHTARQRTYGARLDKGVYTPQMIMDGRTEAVGSRNGEVARAIEAARKGPRLTLAVSATDAGGFSIHIDDGAPAGQDRVRGSAQVWLARYLDEVTTRVRAGENRGKTLVNHHVVTGLIRLPNWAGGASTVETEPIDLAPGEGCAILVQEPDQGAILGAAACPKAPKSQ